MRESKESRFRRVAEARVNKLIKMLRLLANCSHTGNYEYTQEQVGQIFGTLQTDLNLARDRFIHGSGTAKRFSLSEEAQPAQNTPFPCIYLDMPDGTILRATAAGQDEYPSINIERIDRDGHYDLICFAEFNPERGEDGQLCIAAYQSYQDDPTYYEPYEAAERKET